MVTFWQLVYLLLPVASARQITVKNSCASTIWPGLHTGAGTIPTQPTGWELTSGQSTTFEVADNWQAGRVWARTGCTLTEQGMFQCLTANCGPGEGGSKECVGTDEPPATLAEFTLVPDGEDNYDVSLVDGFNIPVAIYPSKADCPQPACGVNINAVCPPLLRTGIDQAGQNLACLHPCNAGFGMELYGSRTCCTGSYNDPEKCAICGVDFYNLYKQNCNTSYAYAYDEKSETALWTCSASSGLSDYTIDFCPGSTDYVGPKEPSDKYASDTATCSSMATAGTQTFSVPPSPSVPITSGTLKVQATAATGVDGAAAVGVTSDTTSAPATSSGPASDSAGWVTLTVYSTTNNDPVTVPVTGSTSASPTSNVSPQTTTALITVTATATDEPTSVATAAAEGAGGTEIVTTIGGSILIEVVNGETITQTLTSPVEIGAVATDGGWRQEGHTHAKGQWLSLAPGV